MSHTISPMLPFRGRARDLPRPRSGSALILVLVFTVALAALAMSAIFLSSNATLLGKSYDRERDFKYATEEALAIGKSRLNNDATAVPDSLWDTILFNANLSTADTNSVPNVTVNLFVGPTGSTTGQFGRFASLVAEARDRQGSRFVRRLEVTQESFAKFAYWTTQETNSGSPIYFGNGDNLWGPVWSNDTIRIAASGAHFHDVVGTSKVITGKSNGIFDKGYTEGDDSIKLPSNAMLAKLAAYATTGGTNFTSPSNSKSATIAMRIEFVAVDLDGDGDSTDVDEGFFKVYKSTTANSGYVRADFDSATAANDKNCGDWHKVLPTGPLVFFPAAIHNNAWAATLWVAGGMAAGTATTHKTASVNTIMSGAGARCYLGGDPHLVALERSGVAGQKGGEDSTFTATGLIGSWSQWTGTIDSRLATLRPWDKNYLFPLYRGLNANTKGVIYVGGSTGVSGTLRGRVTLYARGSLVYLDDMRYATDPGSSTFKCSDIFGVLTDSNIWIADNAVLSPHRLASSGSYFNFDDTKDFYMHSVIMALGTSFGVERYNVGSSNTNGCEGSTNGRGCLYLTGGLIQVSRGAVGLLGGEGYVKRYSYDRCAVVNPPPYFPTTGRFIDNRFYEIDPVRFNVSTLFNSLTPGP